LVRTQPLMGKFMAWQVTLDLIPLFNRWTDNEWAITYKNAYANPGGSAVGLQKIGMDLFELRDRQAEHLDALDLDWRAVAWKGHERLTIADLEHTLCEWVKYDRFDQGLKTRARRFR
jgi:alpha-glutamyl/putrescinyl thymine pyrophosphorylase clade 1